MIYKLIKLSLSIMLITLISCNRSLVREVSKIHDYIELRERVHSLEQGIGAINNRLTRYHEYDSIPKFDSLIFKFTK